MRCDNRIQKFEMRYSVVYPMGQERILKVTDSFIPLQSGDFNGK